MVDELRERGPLKNLSAMSSYCYTHGGELGGSAKNHGYIIETENYRYCLRCNPRDGAYNAYLPAYALRQQALTRHPI